MTRRNVLVQCVIAMVAEKNAPAFILHKDGMDLFQPNGVLHQALAPSLRESKVQLVVQDIWPFRERARGQNCRLNSLSMDITEAGHSSITTLYARIRSFYSTSRSLSLAPAPIWKMQHVMQENTSPMQSVGRKTVSGFVPCCLLPPFSRYVDV